MWKTYRDWGESIDNEDSMIIFMSEITNDAGKNFLKTTLDEDYFVFILVQ